MGGAMGESDKTPRRSAKKARCAIYTRKSSEEGLEQAFNSLDAQREACAAFILSQKHEGWTVLTPPYDDGRFSGGTMERPALKRLIADIEEGQIDVFVVYKVDQLTPAAQPRLTAADQSRPACPCPRLQTSGNRARRARQGDPAQAANDGEGLADNGPRWPGAEPQPEARCASGSGMAWPHAHRHGNGRWVRVCRGELFVADQDRQKDHRSALVGATLLWPASGKCRVSEQWEARWVSQTKRRDAPPKRPAVRFTPENHRRKGWSRLLIRSTPSVKPAPEWDG